MAQYTKEDLRWVMASYSGNDIYGPSRRVFMYEISETGLVFHNVGNHYADEWRIGFRNDRGSLREWSSTHYASIDDALVAANQA